MSQENPTPEELSEIEQFQYGAYGAEPPEWWFNHKNMSRTVIPAEAVEAAAKAMLYYNYGVTDWAEVEIEKVRDRYLEEARAVLSAALPLFVTANPTITED